MNGDKVISELTEEEKLKVLEYAHGISECIYEQDKLFIYATEIRRIFFSAYKRRRS